MIKFVRNFSSIISLHKLSQNKKKWIGIVRNSEFQNSSAFNLVNFYSSDFESRNILQVNSQQWKNRSNVLAEYNFDENECFQILKKHPELLEMSLEDLENSLEGWSLCNLDFNLVRQVLVKQPLLLSVRGTEIQRRILYYNGLCRSKKTLTSFLINCPNACFDDWNVIVEKIEYLFKIKHVKRHELFHSEAIMKSLDFIRLRITLLEKCGIFKTIIIHPHKTRDPKSHTNPTLNKILDTDDETFSEEVAKITIEEYMTFSELFQLNGIEENSESDEEDECKTNSF